MTKITPEMWQRLYMDQKHANDPDYWRTEFDKEWALLKSLYPEDDDEILRTDISLGLRERGLHLPQGWKP